MHNSISPPNKKILFDQEKTTAWGTSGIITSAASAAMIKIFAKMPTNSLWVWDMCFNVMVPSMAGFVIDDLMEKRAGLKNKSPRTLISQVATAAVATGLIALTPPSALCPVATLISASAANLIYQCMTP